MSTKAIERQLFDAKMSKTKTQHQSKIPSLALLVLIFLTASCLLYANTSMNNEALTDIRKKKHVEWLAKRNSDEFRKDVEAIASRDQNDSSISTTSTATATTKRKSEESYIDLTSDDDNDLNQLKSSNNSLKDNSKRFKTDDSLRNIQLPLLSYNVWFGEPHQRARMESIASLVHTSGSYMIGFQEVTTTLAHYLYPKLESKGYSLHSQNFSAYGCAIAYLSDKVKILKSGFLPYTNTIMDRGLLWIHGRINDSSIEVLFTTTHLESWIPQCNGTTERQQQLIQIKRFCENYVSQNPSITAAIVNGDLNWDDQQGPRSKPIDPPLLSLLSPSWIDAWTATKGENDPGYTYDAVSNQMLTGYLKRRFDRFLIYFSNKPSYDSRVSSSTLIGTDPIPGLTYSKVVRKASRQLPVLPSDHYGLAINISMERITK